MKIARVLIATLLLASQPCTAKIWVYNAMTIRADDEALKKKIKSGKICFGVNSVQDLQKNFPSLEWSTTGHRLIGHANQKTKHMFSVFVDRDECRRSARIAADSAHVELGGLAEREDEQDLNI